jgi:hypothetical protein
VDNLIARLKTEKDDRRQAYADALTRVYRKPGVSAQLPKVKSMF